MLMSSKKSWSTGQMTMMENQETNPLSEYSKSLYFYFNIKLSHYFLYSYLLIAPFGIPQQESHNYKVWYKQLHFPFYLFSD